MTRDLQILRLFQVFDSQFPVGAFAHSGGLETDAQSGAGVAELGALLTNQIALGWRRGELAAACVAWNAAGGRNATPELQRAAAPASALKVVPGHPATAIHIVITTEARD